jgi:hypothetical protein
MAHLPIYIPDWLETELGTGNWELVGNLYLWLFVRERVEVKNRLAHNERST